MKTKLKQLVVFGFAFGVILQLNAQGTFQNLGFESATLVPVPGDPYGRVQFAPAFPGWTGHIGASTETLALYDNLYLDSTGLGLQGPGSGLNIDGNYTAMIQSGFALSGPPTQVIASLSQSGLVPADTKSVQFKVNASGPFEVALNGQSLTPVTLSSTSGYILYGVDATAFAGLTTELRFTAIQRLVSPIISTIFIDSISFSNQPIPEPSVFGLVVLGASGLFLFHRKRNCLTSESTH
jgi:hypothetical protein